VPIDDVELLRQSAIVSQIVSASFDGIADSYILKVRVELQNGWLMDFWEHGIPNFRRYSFHVFQGDQMIVRWDNAPHHAHLSTFPHHKHGEQGIKESEEMDLAKVLVELEKMVQVVQG
jgi:hypothetical protein